MNTPERKPNVVGVVGNEGRFGKKAQSVLEQAFAASGLISIEGTDTNSVNDPIRVAKEFNVLIMATPIEDTVTTDAGYVTELANDGIERVYININSVQNSAREAMIEAAAASDIKVVIVNIHPYFGPASSLENARLVFCGVDVVGPAGEDTSEQEQGATENWRQLLESLAKTLSQAQHGPDAQPMKIVDLSSKSIAVDDDTTVTGARLHDYLAAYSQTPYHILRLRLQQQLGLVSELGLPDLDMAGEKSSMALARQVIEQNPFTAELVNLLPQDRAITKEDIVTFLQTVRQKLEDFTKADTEFNFTTPNVRNLVAWLDQP